MSLQEQLKEIRKKVAQLAERNRLLEEEKRKSGVELFKLTKENKLLKEQIFTKNQKVNSSSEAKPTIVKDKTNVKALKKEIDKFIKDIDSSIEWLANN